MDVMEVTETASPVENSPHVIARTWADFLVSQRMLCMADCCRSSYGRTLINTTRYFADLPQDKQDEAVEAMNAIISTTTKEGFVPFFTWDGVVSYRYRSRTGRKGLQAIRGAVVNARSRTAGRR